ncbi:MAG: L-threonine 3-dehydrogenase [Nitrospira sp.]|nr:L-threonine 3-dehydrogenase [Candidatus Manganitrophaceae bacterium]HIL34814.1 L-threonine 3-dehydrogenase [Candidatus Manganitrophaceae bacterium]
MKAIVKTKKGKGLEMHEVPIPSLQADEVMIQVDVVSICGTDLHLDRWDGWAQGRVKALPQIIGHELSGKVVEVGLGVKRFRPGDFVSADSHIPCLICGTCLRGMCHLCDDLVILGVDRDGCFAELVAIPERSLWKNESSLPPDIASIQDPLGNAIYATLVEPVAGREVLILGDGPVGLLSIAVARVSGASRIMMTGLNPLCLEIGRKMGADRVYHADQVNVVEAVMDETAGSGADVVIEMSGDPQAISDGLKMVQKGGRFSAFGLPSQSVAVDFSEEIIFKGIRLYGINGRKMFETWFEMAGMLNSGRLDPGPVLTHHLSFEDFEKGFQMMEASPREAAKVVLYLNKSLLNKSLMKDRGE